MKLYVFLIINILLLVGIAGFAILASIEEENTMKEVEVDCYDGRHNLINDAVCTDMVYSSQKELFETMSMLLLAGFVLVIFSMPNKKFT